MEGISATECISLRNKVLGMYSPMHFHETELELLMATYDMTTIEACQKTPGLAVIDKLADWTRDLQSAALVKLKNLQYLPVIDLDQDTRLGERFTYFITPHPTQRLAMVKNTGLNHLQMGMNVSLHVPEMVAENSQCVVSYFDERYNARRFIVFPETRNGLGFDEISIYNTFIESKKTDSVVQMADHRLVEELIKFAKISGQLFTDISPSGIISLIVHLKSCLNEVEAPKAGVFYGDYQYDELQRSHVDSGELFNILISG